MANIVSTQMGYRGESLPPIGVTPIGLPATLAVVDRYDNDKLQQQPYDDYGLEFGPPPGRIPRLWNISLGSLASLQQFGWKNNFDTLKLTPPIIINPNRNTLASVGSAIQQTRFKADTLGVPAIFVGWNPYNARGAV